MAFNLQVNLEGYEYRGTTQGVSSKTGKPWMSLVLESPTDARQVDVSVPEEYQETVRLLKLEKGNVVDCPVIAVAAQTYNFVRLAGVPVVLSGQQTGLDF